MGREPPGNCGRADDVSVPRGQAAADLIEGMAAIIFGERFEDLANRICLMPQPGGSRREAVVAGAALVKPDCFKLLQAAAPGCDLAAAAMGAALRRFDRRGRGGRACVCGAVEHAGL